MEASDSPVQTKDDWPDPPKADKDEWPEPPPKASGERAGEQWEKHTVAFDAKGAGHTGQAPRLTVAHGPERP